MTTVICDVRAGLMIADSFQEHNGNTMLTSGEKIIAAEQGIFAWSGIHACGQLWAEWMINDDASRERQPQIADTSCIHLDRNGSLWYYGDRCMPMRINEPYYAIGAGCEFAMAAMHCGKTALEAIRIAAYFNAFTKPPFRQYVLKDLQLTIFEA